MHGHGMLNFFAWLLAKSIVEYMQVSSPGFMSITGIICTTAAELY